MTEIMEAHAAKLCTRQQVNKKFRDIARIELGS
jgi:hypothetical protein